MMGAVFQIASSGRPSITTGFGVRTATAVITEGPPAGAPMAAFANRQASRTTHARIIVCGLSPSLDASYDNGRSCHRRSSSKRPRRSKVWTGRIAGTLTDAGGDSGKIRDYGNGRGRGCGHGHGSRLPAPAIPRIAVF